MKTLLIISLVGLFTSCGMLQAPKVVYRTKTVVKEVVKKPKIIPVERKIDYCVTKKIGIGIGPLTSLEICNAIFGFKGK